MATDELTKRKRSGTPADHSLPAKTKMGQKMAVVHRRLSLLGKHVDSDDGFEPKDEKLATVVGQQANKAVDDYDDPPEKVEFVPLRIVRPTSVENEQERRPSFHYKHGARKPKACKDEKLATVVGQQANKAVDDYDDPAEKVEFVPLKIMRPTSVENEQERCPGFHYKHGARKPKAYKDEKLPTVVGQQAKAVDDYDDPAEKVEFVPLRIVRPTSVENEQERRPCFHYKHGARKPKACKDEKLATVVGGQQAKAVDDCDDPAEKVEFIPLRIVRPTSEENGQERRPEFRYKHGARQPKAYKRERETQEGSKSSKSKKEEKPMLSLPTSVGSNTPEEESPGEDVNSREYPKVTPFTNSFGDDTDFDTVKSFEDFNIVLDGLVVNRWFFPRYLRKTYYQLCCARKTFLHRHLVKHVSPTFAAGLIVETARIAEGIMASHASSSSLEKLVDWKTTLKSLESLGMDVTLLHKHVNDLQMVVEEKLVAQEKMRALKSKMSSINDAVKEISMEMEEIEESVTKMQKYLAFRQLATAPW